MNDICIYYASINDYAYDKLLCFQSKERLDYINSLNNHVRKKQSALSGALLYYGVMQYLSHNYNNFRSCFDNQIDNTTSFLDLPEQNNTLYNNISSQANNIIESLKVNNNGRWCFSLLPTLYFSISHSYDYCMVAFAPFNIGVDIELVRPKNTCIANRFFSANELSIISKHNNLFNDSPSSISTLIWSAKESLIKILQNNKYNIFNTNVISNMNFSPLIMKYNTENQNIAYNTNELFHFVIDTPDQEYQSFVSYSLPLFSKEYVSTFAIQSQECVKKISVSHIKTM